MEWSVVMRKRERTEMALRAEMFCYNYHAIFLLYALLKKGRERRERDCENSLYLLLFLLCSV